MADEEQLERLKSSVKEWNEWRRQQPDLKPDLRRANLRGADLREADLRRASFINATFIGADLSDADLSDAILINADLSDTNLSDVELSRANLIGANFTRANLSRAILGFTNLSTVNLSNANFTEVHFLYTTIAWVDLSSVKGLETALHYSPSILAINSVRLPTDKTARSHFLRGVGFTETQIEYLPSLLMPGPIQYQSLFISYAGQDEAIARQLHTDLRKKDVPCWFAPHDLKPADDFREEIEKAIHMQEKLLLILSKDSVNSKWVKYEVNRALNREIEQDRNILYPIRLDDTVLNSTSGWAADLRAHRHIGDFTGWQDDAAYQQAFEKLLRDLKVSRPPMK